MSAGSSSSPERGGVPWSEAISSGPSSTSAPGPPSSQLLLSRATPTNTKKKAKHASSGEEDTTSLPNSLEELSEITAAARSGDMERWDPMKMDYHSKSFNSYTNGPGTLIQSREEKDVTLFVNHIPSAITKDGVRNLFSEVAPVKRVSLIPVKSGQKTTFGFVEFSTVREAEMAIQRFNNKDMGHNIRLLVKISESKKQQEERKKIQKEDAEFSRTLHCAEHNTSFEQLESDDDAEKEISNPLQPRYISSTSCDEPSSRSILNTLIESPIGEKALSASLRDTGRDQNSPMKTCDQEGAVATSKACVVCQKPAANRCSRCKIAYCTEVCQREDWPRHKEECVGSGSSKINLASTASASSVATELEESAIRIAEESDDDGFVLDCPSAEELAGIKTILHHAKTSDDLASLLSDSVTSQRKSGTRVESGFQGEHITPKGRGSRLFDVFQGKGVKTSPSDTKEFGQQSTQATPLPRVVSRQSSRFNFPSKECFVEVKSIYSQLEKLEKLILSLPLLSSPPPEFVAIATFYASPCVFNVIIPSVETKQALRHMHSFALTQKSVGLSASQLSQGSKCGYINEQGDFMRVVVHEIFSPAEILVAGYDFGGQYLVRASDLVVLPEDLVCIPCLVQKCVLKDVEVSEEGKADLVSAISALKKLIDNQPIFVNSFGVQAGSIICTIHGKDNGQDLIASLLQSQYFNRVAPAPSGACPAQSKCQSQLPLRLSYSASKVDYHRVQPGAVVVLLPTVVINPSIIWAQVNHPHLKNMEAMHLDLNISYPPADASSNPYVPAIGEMCVAKYSQDQKYYRAEVLRVHHNGMADVRFTETGRCENVTVSQVYHISPAFLTLPRQARKFSLRGIEPNQSITWSDNAIAFLKDKILNRHVTVKVISVTSEQVLVDMFDPDLPNQLMSNSLILLGHAQIRHDEKSEKSSSKISMRGVRTSESPSDYRYDDAPPLSSGTLPHLGPQTSPTSNRAESIVLDNNDMHRPNFFKLSEGDIVDVSLSHMNSLERFYVQLVEPSHFSKVEAALGKILTTKLVPLPQKHIKKGVLCLCHFSEDNQVHRAQIIGCKGDRVTVVFRDYGNVFNCNTDMVYKISEELLELPFQAIACSLNQVRNPAGNKKDWDSAALACFQELIESGPLKAKVVKIAGVLHVVDMRVKTSREDIDVLKAMISSGYVLPQNRELQGSMQKRASQSNKKQLQDSDMTQAFKDTWSNMKPQFGKKVQQNEQDSKTLTKSFSLPDSDVHTPSSSLYLPPHPEISRSSSIGDEKLSPQKKLTAVSDPHTPISPSKNETVVVPKLWSSTSDLEKQFPPLSSLQKLLFPRNLPSVDVIVTEVVSLTEIYVQLDTSESVAAIKKVSELLASVSSTGHETAPACLPPINSVCCTKFSQDHMWYRCSVESVCKSSYTVSVQFIDYGNREKVHASDIVACPVKCLSVPIVAVRCSLSGTSSVEVDEPRAVEFIKTHTGDDSTVSAHIVSLDQDILSVSFKTKDFDFLTEMTNQGIVKAKNKTVVFSLISSLEKMSLPSDLSNVKVIISEVVSSSEVYVQIACNEVRELLIKIGEGLHLMLPSTQSSLDQFPEVGSLCCAKFSTDMHWYRAEILEIQDSTASVQFVDYGNVENVALKDILPCPSEFCSFPLLAIKCQLDGLQCLTSSEEEKVTQYLCEHTSNSIFSPKISDDGDNCLLTLQTDSGSTLLSELKTLKLIGSQFEFPLAKNIQRVQLPKTGEFHVLLGDVRSSSKFYVQLATTENGHILQTIAEGLNSTCSLSSLDSLPNVGILCCARFSLDKQWYRAEVLSVAQGNCEVFFVDYGNFENIASSDLALCPVELSSLPMQAVECSLSGIPVELEWGDKVKQYFQQNLSDQLLVAMVEDEVNGVPQLKLSKDGEDVLNEMIQLQLFSPISGNTIHLVKDLKTVELPSDEFKCIITEVVSPLKFYIQVVSLETSTMVDTIATGINDPSRPLVPLSSPPKVGLLCCAKFSVDMQWYRVEITDVTKTRSKVFFLDYGNQDEVVNSDLAICPDDLAVMPKVAIECGLNEFPVNSSSMDDCISYFKNILNKLLLAQAVGEKDLVPLLNISNNGVNILPELLKLMDATVMVEDMTYIELPSGSFSVMVSEVVNSTEVYIQVATQDVAHLEKRISSELVNITQDTSSFSLPPPVGSLCCAKFSSDMQWYRAEVIRIQNEEVKVSFIDYGNSDVVPISNLAPCPHTLASLPRIASRCAISGIPAELAMSDEVTKYLKQNITGELVTVTVSLSKNNIFIDIMKDGKSLIDEMSQLGILENLSVKKYMVKNMGHVTLPTSGLFRVNISEVISDTEFYVQLVTEKVGTLLTAVTERINTISEPLKSLSTVPEVGSLCCAKFSDNLWYRAEVLQVSDGEILVKFIDYGNNESLKISDLASCPSEIAEQPCVAVPCRWANSQLDTSVDCSDVLKAYVNKILSAKIVGQENNVPQLELFDEESNVLKPVLPLKSSPAKSSVELAKNMKHISLPSSIDFELLVSEIVNPNNFFVQLATAEVGKLLSDVTEMLNKESSSLKQFKSHPSEGVFCCAKFSEDQQWYRAEVLQINGSSSCTVMFVDYGNTAVVPVSDLAMCPPECSDLPLIACQCCLSGFPLHVNISSEVVEIFKQHVSTSSFLSAKLIAETNGVSEVELFNMGDCILDKILKQLPSTAQSLPLVSSLERMQIPLNKLVSVSITEITSLDKVYVQLATQQVAMMLNDISDGLNESFDSKYLSLTCSPATDSLCCAQYSVDSLWYRAQVLDVEGDKFTVKFIDYGNTDVLPLSSLAACPSQFVDFPVLAVHCSIAEISKDLVESIDCVVDFLKDVTYDIGTTLEVVDVVDDIPQIRLFIDGTNVSTLLDLKGFIQTTSCGPANLEMLKFPSAPKYVKCLVYEVCSFSEFYVHVDNKELSSMLGMLEERIAKFIDGSPKCLTAPPAVKDLVLAKFSGDGMWYRARVESVSNEELNVLYLDYRNFEKIHISNVLACPAQLASIPQVAIKCGLYGLPSDFVSTDKLVSTFKNLTNGSILEGKKICEIEGVPQIELRKGGKSIVSFLDVPKSNAPLFSNMKKLQLPSGETFQLIVCEVITPSELYIQVNNDATVSAIKIVNEILKDSSKLVQLTTFPPVGSVCCAKFAQDGLWYRARVGKISGKTCQIFFFDFGNFEEVNLTEMSACPSSLLNIPVISIKCSLHGLESFSAQEWTPSARSILKSITTERLLNASIVSNKLDDSPSLQLTDVNGTLISVEFKSKYRPSVSALVTLRKCQVTEVNNPGSLYFQYLDADNANNLSLLNKLQKVYANPIAYSGFIPAVGSLCCARYSEDLNWYRCKILALTTEAVQLYYMDFGSIDSVPKTAVYRLDDAFTAPPPFAIHVKIRGIGPKDGISWTEAATHKLSSLCDKILYVSVVELNGNMASVDLFEDENKQSSIADILVSCGLASYI